MKSFSKITNKLTEYQSKTQQIIYQLIDLLFNPSLDNSDDMMNHALTLVGEFFDVEHILIYEYLFDLGIMNATHIYPNTEHDYIALLKELSLRAFLNPMINEHNLLKPYIITDVLKLDQHTALHQMLASKNIKSLSTYPIIINHECVGSLVFENFRFEQKNEIVNAKIIELLLHGIANIMLQTKLNQKVNALHIDKEMVINLKSQFLANMSHEIRTPLSGVYNAMYLLGSTELSVEQKEYLELGQSSIDALSHIVEDLLDISKIETGKMEVYQDTFNLEDELVRMIKSLKSFADEKGIELFFNYDYQLINELVGDIQKIRQILLNLLNNAIKFTQTGSVTLEVKGINHQSQFAIEFSIVDTGIGMDEEHLKHIFDAFYQIDSSETKKQKGTGLGLSICYQLTELLKGELQIRSKLNQGSIFSLTLPFKKGKSIEYPLMSSLSALLIDPLHINDSFQQMIKSMGIKLFDLTTINDSKVDFFIINAYENNNQMSEYQTKYGKNHLVNVYCSYEQANQLKERDLVFNLPTSRQIFYQKMINLLNNDLKQEDKYQNFINASALIVDDNRLNRIALANILQKLGMKSKSVESGKAAIETVKKETFDIILMDIQMPEMDGMEATRRIRSLGKSNQTIPIIAVTANAFLKDYDLMKISQITDVIFKPIKPDSLTQILRKYITSKNAIEIPIELFTFDQHEFEMRFEGSLDIAQEVLSTFIEEYRKDLDKIRKAINDQNTEQIIQTAHYFKGSCSYLSAKKIVWLLDYMMNMAKSTKLENMNELMISLDKEVEGLIVLIKEFQL
jgi:signal transduction histidine kinase/CheY-like chemotaxis protein/HPt (histidine-containing phosphotransfer) domain-containing protein